MLGMIADYMENGFLDNIVDMFKHDSSLYPLIGDMLADKRGRVRIGTVALVETLKETDSEKLRDSVPGVARLLKNSNAAIRGDAAFLLGIIGSRESLPLLNDAANDENEMVREIIEDSISTISALSSSHTNSH